VRSPLWLGLVGVLACGGRAEPAREPEQAAEVPADAVEAAAPVVLFLGTSLTAGLGLSESEAYPALVQRKVDSAGLRFRVVNAGESGGTSAGGLGSAGLEGFDFNNSHNHWGRSSHRGIGVDVERPEN